MQHQIATHRLANGVTVITVPVPGTSTITSVVFFRVGSRYEADHQQGLAHFTEHLVFKGGVRYPTSRDVTQTVDGIGGEMNAFTSYEYTGFYVKAAKEHVATALDVLSDITLHATFPEQELEKEKGVITEEINMYEDLPMRRVDHVLMEQLFGDTPLGRRILGTKDSVANFTQQDFLNYRQQFYHGDSCVVVLAGAVSPEESQKLGEEYFSSLPSGSVATYSPAHFHEKPAVLADVRPGEQYHLQLAVPGLPLAHESAPTQKVLDTILGGTMSSRLFVAVREERGLCYYVRAGSDALLDTGVFSASAGVDVKRLDVAVQAIIDEFKRLRDEGVTEEELVRAKAYLTGKAAMSMEGSDEVAMYYGLQYALEYRTDSVSEHVAKIQEVTAQQVQELAKQLFVPGSARLAVVGPQPHTETLEGILASL